MSDFDAMTEQQINKAVAILKGRYLAPPKGCEVEIRGDVECYYDDMRTIWDCHFDYCGSWGDAGPILVENKISINFRSEKLMPTAKEYQEPNNTVADENPLRAAMIVFMKIKGAKWSR